MTYRRSSIYAVCVSFALLGPYEQALAVVIAQFDPNPSPNISAQLDSERIFAQTFTAETTAEVRQVDLTLTRNGNFGPGFDAGDVTIELRGTASGGVPSSAVLTSVTVPSTAIPVVSGLFSGTFASFILPTPVWLNAGGVYAIVAIPTSPGLSPYLWSGLNSEFFPVASYAGGQEFQMDNTPNSSAPGEFVPAASVDLGFRAIGAVPEPSSVTLVALSLILLAGRWWYLRKGN